MPSEPEKHIPACRFRPLRGDIYHRLHKRHTVAHPATTRYGTYLHVPALFTIFAQTRTMKTLKFLSFGIITLLVIILVAATIVEHVHDTRMARELFYASPAVLVLWVKRKIMPELRVHATSSKLTSAVNLPQ